MSMSEMENEIVQSLTTFKHLWQLSQHHMDNQIYT